MGTCHPVLVVDLQLAVVPFVPFVVPSVPFAVPFVPLASGRGSVGRLPRAVTPLTETCRKEPKPGTGWSSFLYKRNIVLLQNNSFGPSPHKSPHYNIPVNIPVVSVKFCMRARTRGHLTAARLVVEAGTRSGRAPGTV